MVRRHTWGGGRKQISALPASPWLLGLSFKCQRLCACRGTRAVWAGAARQQGPPSGMPCPLTSLLLLGELRSTAEALTACTSIIRPRPFLESILA